MMKYILLSVIILSNISYARSIRPGRPSTAETIILKTGIEYSIPECRTWWLKDLNKVSHGSQISINGKIEIKSQINERSTRTEHFIEGDMRLSSFFYHKDTKIRVIVYPGSKVILLPKYINENLNIEVLESDWLLGGCHREKKS